MPDVRPTFADEVDAMLMAEREPPAYAMAASCVTCGVEMNPAPNALSSGSVLWACPTCKVIVEVSVR
jgi:predicted RNA-binding Zn-ribbon protein involved in translation (DUF1610 family)